MSLNLLPVIGEDCNVTIRDCAAAAAELTAQTPAEILDHTRGDRALQRARALTIWLARAETEASYLLIARVLGRRDHSSIHKAGKRAERYWSAELRSEARRLARAACISRHIVAAPALRVA